MAQQHQTADAVIEPGCIAIVGLAGHFPAARSAAELWSLLTSGQPATEWLSAEQLRAAGVPEAICWLGRCFCRLRHAGVFAAKLVDESGLGQINGFVLAEAYRQ